VRKATVEYHAPARYDDELLVCGGQRGSVAAAPPSRCPCTAPEDTSRPLVSVELVYVCVDRRGAPTAWPPEIRERMHRYEAVAPAEEPPRG